MRLRFKCNEKEIIHLASMAVTHAMASIENFLTTTSIDSTTICEAKIGLKIERNHKRPKSKLAKQANTYDTNANCASVSDFWLTFD